MSKKDITYTYAPQLAEQAPLYKAASDLYDEQKYQQAVSILKDLVKKDACAQNLLGVCYHYGHGVAKNHKKAFKLFLSSAKCGYGKAKRNVAKCYLFGDGVKQNCAEAIVWLRDASLHGDYNARLDLGDIYYYGHGDIRQNYVSAAYVYELIAEEGGAEIQMKLADCYLHWNNDEGRKKAVKWLTSAAQLGNMDAQYQLGVCYEKGQGVSQDYQQAVAWYQKSAQQGCAAAQSGLGDCYLHGRGVKQSDEEAYNCFFDASQKEDPNAYYQLGRFYDNGTYVQRDRNVAAQYFYAAAQKGHAEAQTALAFYYENGLGVSMNFNGMFYWYTQAANQGQSEAYRGLARCYKYGHGAPEDKQKALQMYTKAANLGNVQAQLDLVEVHILDKIDGTRNFDQALYWLKRAADSGDDGAQKVLQSYKKTGKLFGYQIY